MPGVTKQDLYLAHSVGELNNMAEQLPPVNNVKACVISAQKLFKRAEELSMLGDEEKAYVLYMRFFNLIRNVKKTAEYKKNEKYYKDLIGMKTLSKAMDNAETLSNSLKIRYEEKEAEKISKKLEILDKKKEECVNNENKENSEKTDENGEVEKDEKDELTKVDEKTSMFISPNKLYAIMNDGGTRLLIMDVRSVDEFMESHIRHPHCINVPADIVPPGITSNQIENKLPAESKDLWKRRTMVDFIILLNWTGCEEDIVLRKTLKNLKDAIYKWDVTNVIKSEPLVLQGGYNDFLLYYPTFTTNSKVKRPLQTMSSEVEVPSLDAIDYDLELSFLKNPEELAKEQESSSSPNFNTEQTSDKLKEFHVSVPSVDRSKKPSVQPPANNMNNAGMKAVQQSTKLNIKQSKINNLDSAGEETKKPTKDTNIISQGTVQVPKPEVNRDLKPKVIPPAQESDSSSDELPNSNISSGNDSLINVDRISPKAVDYLDDNQKIRRENERLILEHKARLMKLRKERDEMTQLQKIKAEHMKETASLMLMKKQIQQEILELEDHLAEQELFLAAKKEQSVDEQMKKHEEEDDNAVKKSNLSKSESSKSQTEVVTDSPVEQHPPAQGTKTEPEIPTLPEESPTSGRLSQEEELAMDKLKQEKLEKERLRQEQEEKIRQNLEENTRKEQEMRKKQVQEATEKKAESHEVDSSKVKAAEKSNLVTPGLKAGWQKLLDPKTGRYYYVNHNTKQTQWEPPQLTSMGQASPAKTYKIPLKKETNASFGQSVGAGGGGLVRCHSSPNIAKMMADEEKHDKVIKQPIVDRGNKPKLSKGVQPVMFQTEVSGAKVRNLQPIWGSMGRGLTGLRNLGNTCYMNSIIQCLSNTIPLTTYFLGDHYKMDINRENIFGKGGEVAEEYAVLIKALWCGQYKSVSPRDFKTTVGKYHELFASYSQQDSQELLLFLMDGLHEDLNTVTRRRTLPEQINDGIPDEEAAERAWKLHKSVNESIIVELFQGQFKSTVRCLTCSRKSVTFDVFMYLTLPVPSSGTRISLRDCFLNFSKEEKMTGASRWHCPRCKCPRDAVKQIVIWKLPPILLIHLKRFYYQGMWRQKITTTVDFPLDSLDMNKFISGPNQKALYSLYAVSNHYGSLDGGHYTAFCNNASAKRWYKYDDHEVYDINARDIQSPAAYILFYTCIEMSPVFR